MGFKQFITITTLVFCCLIEMSGVGFQIVDQEVTFWPSSSGKVHQFLTSNYFQSVPERLFLTLSWSSAFGMLVAYFTKNLPFMKGMLLLKTILVIWNMLSLAWVSFKAVFGYEFHFLFVQLTFAGAQIVFLSCLTIDFEHAKLQKWKNYQATEKSPAAFV